MRYLPQPAQLPATLEPERPHLRTRTRTGDRPRPPLDYVPLDRPVLVASNARIAGGPIGGCPVCGRPMLGERVCDLAGARQTVHVACASRAAG